MLVTENQKLKYATGKKENQTKLHSKHMPYKQSAWLWVVFFPFLWSRVSHIAMPHNELSSHVDTQHNILYLGHLNKLAAHYQIEIHFVQKVLFH